MSDPISAWMSTRDDFVMGETDPDVGLSDNATFFAHAIDGAVVSGLFKQEDDGQMWTLMPVVYRDGDEMDADIIVLLAANAGQVKVLGVWDFDGGKYKNGNPGEGGYLQYPSLLDYMPDVINPGDPEGPLIPATVVTDVNLLAGQSPRDFG